MDRGLRAQLSPNEEATLKVIAAGTPQTAYRRPADIQHLLLLKLIENQDGAWGLTDVGALRFKILRPRAR